MSMLSLESAGDDFSDGYSESGIGGEETERVGKREDRMKAVQVDENGFNDEVRIDQITYAP